MPEWREEGSFQTPCSHAGQQEGDRENGHHEGALWSPAPPAGSVVLRGFSTKPSPPPSHVTSEETEDTWRGE